MNTVGQIGEFMIAHQEVIEYMLMGLLALIIVLWIVGLLLRAAKRRNLLREIDKKVSDIDTRLSGLSGRDSFPEQEENARRTQEKPHGTNMFSLTMPGEMTGRPATGQEPSGNDTGKTDSTKKGVGMSGPSGVSDFTYGWGQDLAEADRRAASASAEKPGLGPKMTGDEFMQAFLNTFNSRECGTDKHGHSYTEEDLRRQIN